MMDTLFKTTAMKYFLLLVFATMATMVVTAPKTSVGTKEENSQSVGVNTEDSASRLPQLTDTDSAEAAFLSDDEITDYVENSDKSVPRVSNLVARVKQREERRRILWRGTLGAATITGPLRIARVVDDESSAQADQGRDSEASDPSLDEAPASQEQDVEGSEDEEAPSTRSSGSKARAHHGG